MMAGELGSEFWSLSGGFRGGETVVLELGRLKA